MKLKIQLITFCLLRFKFKLLLKKLATLPLVKDYSTLWLKTAPLVLNLHLVFKSVRILLGIILETSMTAQSTTSMFVVHDLKFDGFAYSTKLNIKLN